MTSLSYPPSIPRILLGTRNRAKIEIVRAALESLPIALLTLDELNIEVEVVEDGDTAQQNAGKKARAYLAASGIPTLAIDGALHIAAFAPDSQPGVFVWRIHASGGEATEEKVLDHYRRALEAVGGESTGTWTGAMALALSPERVVVDSYSFDVLLTSRPRGSITPGAPLDALAIDRASGKYYTELSWKERPDTQRVFEFVSGVIY